ncbi:MAG: Hsp70 family protein, partial [Phycisphaerae bacterium]|nr:Hsp70 family protein [Fodinibius sp.]NIU57833.1 Hsp70 family protein [Phycisphaerae bacterium]NIV12473.1 Hsp70 family protein [Fodinibius sp.]NIW94271.1 Hsp70 family protein [Phycisphaerae bacterium]NIY26161.1 Hsp70 family protein [Fodinibius sp.]
MAKEEPKKINIVGIDLGTTFSALAILNGIGKPEIVPNADGERLTPSAIFFDEENSDVVRVGIEAVNSRLLNAQRSIRWIKRHMGDANYRKTIDGKDWTPVELSALILKKLKEECASEHGEICDAVISVPAHFDEVRRKATMDAGTAAGLNVVGIVNEPVAAALYYATTRDVSGKVLVYDLGGGTFDVTIMDVKGHQMQIVCSQGDHALGGADFDQKILEIMEKSYNDKFGADLITSDEDRAKYEDDAEDIKKTLSRRLSAKKMLYGPAGNMRVEIKREMFEETIASLIARTDILVEVVLDEAGLKPSDIDQVLLVGGSTRIPLVLKHLEKTFGFKPETAVNVDECVALGAALQAGLTMLRETSEDVPVGISNGLKDINLTDVCNHSYGTICAPVDNETGRRIIQNRIILKKNTPLPCEATQMFYTVSEGQTELEVTISQGEDSAPEYVTKIATHKFQLPPDRPAERPIKVTYSYDVNQRMHCKFEDVESGRTLEVDCSLDKKGNMTEEKEKGKKLE